MALVDALATPLPVLIDNSPERQFEDIQPGDPREAEEVAEEAAERERVDPDGPVPADDTATSG